MTPHATSPLCLNETWAAVVEALAGPAAYPFPVQAVEQIRTHISVLFLTEDRVYKVKRPLRLSFLDYSTLERRLFYCEQEVLLNRRLAGSTYRRVVPITRNGLGTIQVDGEGEPIEYAVEMERLPEQFMLDHLLEQGEVDNELAGRLAERLASFHRAADDGPAVAVYGTPAAIRHDVEENLQGLAQLREQFPAAASPLLVAHADGSLDRFLAEEEPRLRARVDQERIREGHGDLHAGNCCVLPDRLVIYDCIEFDERLRCLDVAQDLAFLAMDLDFRGYRAFSAWLVRHYEEAARDPGVRPLLRFYKSHLALVRAKVALLRAAGLNPGEAAQEAAEQAAAYVQLAASYSLPPSLVVLCGLPGTGKTWVAEHIARALGFQTLHSDVTRKRLAGLPVHARPPEERTAELYSPAMTQRTYDTLRKEARDLLQEGRSVVLDANCPTPESRQRFLRMATEQLAPHVVVCCEASEDVIRRRLEQRPQRPTEASDADYQVYQQLKERFHQPADAPEFVRCHSPEPPTVTIAHVLEQLLRQLRQDGRLPAPFPTRSGTRDQLPGARRE